MRIAKLRWSSFSVPFRSSFATSKGVIYHTDGLIIRLETDTRIAGFGEATSLPEFEGGTVRDLAAALQEIVSQFIGRDVLEALTDLDDVASEQRGLAAVKCGLETALLDAIAKEKGISIARFLADAPETEITVNATIGAASIEEATKASTLARNAGFQTVKLKVGMAPDVEGEVGRVGAVREALGPDIALRLDANGAWNANQAIATIGSLEQFDLELIEQPTPSHEFSTLLDVRIAVSTPIAADESVTGIEAAERLLGIGAVQVLVLKPMVVGGLRTAYRIAQTAAASGVRCIVTTTIDAGVATAAALHLAAAVKPQGLACGLATGELLATDLLVRPLEISSGRMKVPLGSGLGVQVDENLLTSFATGIVGEVP